MSSMQLYLLHLDDALELQPEFRETCQHAGARDLDVKTEGRALRLWGRPAEFDDLKRKIANVLHRDQHDAVPLCFMGSGDFHHVSALLVELALQRETRPVTIIHFDNHPDWVHFKNGMHCGSWINRALQHPLVEKIVTIGVCSNDLHRPESKGANLSLLNKGRLELYPYDHPPSSVKELYGSGASFHQDTNHIHWKTIAACGEKAFQTHLASRIHTNAVYITVDKDVLTTTDAVTNWDQGQMSLPYLLSLIRDIGQRHRIVGADVTGDYSRPNYSGNLARVVMKRGEIMIDQPRAPRDLAASLATNSAVNHQLLETFMEVMP